MNRSNQGPLVGSHRYAITKRSRPISGGAASLCKLLRREELGVRIRRKRAAVSSPEATAARPSILLGEVTKMLSRPHGLAHAPWQRLDACLRVRVRPIVRGHHQPRAHLGVMRCDLDIVMPQQMLDHIQRSAIV